jgi:hypothetical protein
MMSGAARGLAEPVVDRIKLGGQALPMLKLAACANAASRLEETVGRI